MNKLVSGLFLAALLNAAAAYADPVATPAMGGSIANNPSPTSFDAGFGNIFVTGR